MMTFQLRKLSQAPAQGEFKHGSRRRKEADFGAKDSSASLPHHVECKIESAENRGTDKACEIARPGIRSCLEFSEHVCDRVIAQLQRFQARDFAVHLAQQTHARDQAQPLRVTLTQLLLLNKPR